MAFPYLQKEAPQFHHIVKGQTPRELTISEIEKLEDFMVEQACAAYGLGFEGIAPADKGFIDAYRHSLLLDRHQILVVTPARKNMKTNLPKPLRQFCRRIRKCVETVGSHLTERFKVNQIRVHDLWHFQHRLIRKILAHTVCLFLNLMFRRSPLDLDALVSA